jgi:hypothetical protein
MENHHQQQQSNKRTSQNMIIDLSTEHQPSEYFQALQSLLQRASRHAASEQDEMCNRDEIIKLFDATMDVLNKQTLPSNAYRSTAFYLLQLMLLISE